MFTLPSKRKKPHPSYLRADTPPHRSQEAGVAGAAAAAAAAAADVAVAVVARFGAVRTPEVAVVALGRLGKGPVNVHADCGRTPSSHHHHHRPGERAHGSACRFDAAPFETLANLARY